MKYRISFGPEAADVGENDLDGVAIRFPFTVQAIHQGAEKDISENHTATIRISESLIHSWNLGSSTRPLQNNDLLKTLFDFVRREIETKLETGSLEQHSRIDLYSGKLPASNPFDPAKIQDPVSYTCEIECPNRIGF